MRLHIHIDDDEPRLGGRRRFLLPLADDADVRQLRAPIRAHLPPNLIADHDRLDLRTADGYQLDANDADRVADLIAADTVVVVGAAAAADPDGDLIARLERLGDDEHRWRSLIALAVLPPPPTAAAVAERALASLCRSLTDEARLDRLGEFVAHEAGRRHRLDLLLDVRADLLQRLLPALISSSAIRGAVVADSVGAAPSVALVVLCRAAGIAPSATAAETVRALARDERLRAHVSALTGGELLVPGPSSSSKTTTWRRWTAPAIEALSERLFDRELHRAAAEPEPERLRAFARAALETRFGARLAADATLLAALAGRVRDEGAPWAARLLGLLDRHGRTSALSATIADLLRSEPDPILRLHLTTGSGADRRRPLTT